MMAKHCLTKGIFVHSFQNSGQCTYTYWLNGVREPSVILYSLDLCRHSTSKSNVDHVYLIFKTENAVQSLKDYLHMLDEASFWKQSCRISFNPSKCPVGLIKRIEAIAGSTFSLGAGPSTHWTSGEASGMLGSRYYATINGLSS